MPVLLSNFFKKLKWTLINQTTLFSPHKECNKEVKKKISLTTKKTLKITGNKGDIKQNKLTPQIHGRELSYHMW